MRCPFSVKVWKEVEGNLEFTNLWNKGSTSENFNEWFDKRELKKFRAGAYLLTWGIWLARNTSIFEDKHIPSFQDTARALALLSSFQNVDRIKRPRLVGDLIIDNTTKWSFFDGACQGPGQLCGLGYVLFLSDSHYYTGRANIVDGTNNYAEFKALLFLLMSALNKGLVRQQVYGDSALTVNIQVHNIGLHSLALQLKDLARQFQVILFAHIYIESTMPRTPFLMKAYRGHGSS
jgi:hypothetical protein